MSPTHASKSAPEAGGSDGYVSGELGQQVLPLMAERPLQVNERDSTQMCKWGHKCWLFTLCGHFWYLSSFSVAICELHCTQDGKILRAG